MVTNEDALLELLGELKSRDYRFTCVTPATHERVLARRIEGEPTLRDIFGWNRPFTADQLPQKLLGLLQDADCLEERDGQLRSRLRVATLDEHLFLHSPFPTSSPDAVFFGPDTYRFVRFVEVHLCDLERNERIVDMGAGSGAGGIIAGSLAPSAQLTLVDVNPAAGELARINARFARVDAEVTVSDRIPEGCDLIIANPPYMIDATHRTYRDGGAMLGGEMAGQWASEALRALMPGGTMLLYTGAAFVDGNAPLQDYLASLCSEADAVLQIEEIDPDVFGDELERPDYAEVERIAALGIRITKPGDGGPTVPRTVA